MDIWWIARIWNELDMAGMAKCAINLVLREIRDPSSAGVICEVDSNMVFRDSIAEMI